jgi:hypothetical protein
MKIILYYLLLLVSIALITGFIISQNSGGAMSMSMTQAASLSGVLALYIVAMSFVGEGKLEDERAGTHRHIANRAGLLAGTVIMALGIMTQLFISHKIDYWLLTGLIVINLTKIVSLIWLNYKK